MDSWKARMLKPVMLGLGPREAARSTLHSRQSDIPVGSCQLTRPIDGGRARVVPRGKHRGLREESVEVLGGRVQVESDDRQWNDGRMESEPIRPYGLG